MNTSRYARRVLGSLLIVCGSTFVTAPPAQSACVIAYLAVHYEQAPDQVLVDPSQCLVPTPFPQYPLTIDASDRHYGEPLSPGMPSGYSFQIWIPA